MDLAEEPVADLDASNHLTFHSIFRYFLSILRKIVRQVL